MVVRISLKMIGIEKKKFSGRCILIVLSVAIQMRSKFRHDLRRREQLALCGLNSDVIALVLAN
jgi:hypothetical protein